LTLVYKLRFGGDFTPSQCLCFHFQIDLCIYVGHADLNMAEPGADRIEIDAASQ